MTIQDNRNTNKKTFGSLRPGDVFVKDGFVYLKLFEDAFNVAVNLTKNTVSHFDNIDEVIQVSATVVVENV